MFHQICRIENIYLVFVCLRTGYRFSQFENNCFMPAN
eukprot:UN09549